MFFIIAVVRFENHFAKPDIFCIAELQKE